MALPWTRASQTGEWFMAARPGVEPGLPGPEPGVLPLDDLAMNYELLIK